MMTNSSNISIYALIDPRDNSVRYVGLTNNPQARLRNHINGKSGKVRNAWIADLKANNLKPHMRILETTDEAHAQEMEHKWYMHYLNEGAKLTNLLSTEPINQIRQKGWRKAFSFALTDKRRRLLTDIARLLHEKDGLPISEWDGTPNLTALMERALEIAVDALNEDSVKKSTP